MTMKEKEILLRLVEAEIGRLPLDDTEPRGLYAPIRYILEDGGKRIRPLLCLMGADVYGGEPEKALPAAVAVEVFHNFTLLHDDIMDKAELRRGRPAVHLKWGESGAILSGDAMLILAYRILQNGTPVYGAGKLPGLLEVFNRAAMEVCQGQQYDMDFETCDRPVTRDEYIGMIRLKTSVLLAAALEMGAVVGGASDAERRSLYDFGVNLGLAFQIQDDLLDTYGDAETFGKKIGGDIAAGKKTFLHIAAMEKASAPQRDAILAPGDIGEKLPRVRAVYDALGVREAAETAIAEYFGLALEALRRAHPQAGRLAVLEEYAYSLMKRNK
ncbi:polyprenyl synthetase family protein [Rikenella microfusus]|uniref:polyprenyl synthetase family protein n=1 Tax=Rikenella microfusus TaxID=28139 RepID=UPI001E02C374|nr:polyprenyl synthetase family protein [Rikenella microfusus]HJE89164.1 polyprenyl synthetase family protein [Rikenella microfusus]